MTSSTPHITSEEERQDQTRARFFAIALVAILALLSAFLIVRNADIEPVFDQTFISYTFSEGYPDLESGITSKLIVGTFNAIVPYEPMRSNALLRALAAMLYVLAGGLLAWSLTGHERLWAFPLFMGLLFTSKFPFLWLSSEVFAGALLMLVLWTLVRKHPFAVTGALVVLFAFAKPDLIVPAGLLGFYLAFRNDTMPRLQRVGIMAGLVTLMVLPGIITVGLEYLRSGGRSMASFGQHYAAMIAPHQLTPPPHPWNEWELYTNNKFFRANGSIGGVISTRPDLYMDFVFLSMSQSIRRMGTSNLLLLLPVAIFCFRALRTEWKVISLLVLVNLVPIVLLSFLHVRYQARFYPLALFVIVGSLSFLAHKKHEYAVAACLGGLFLYQLLQSAFFYNTAHWFPD